jgi:hypothetical protein
LTYKVSLGGNPSYFLQTNPLCLAEKEKDFDIRDREMDSEKTSPKKEWGRTGMHGRSGVVNQY